MFHSFFITIPEGGKSKIKVPIDLVLDEGPLLVHRWLSYMVEGRRELSEVCFFKSTNPILESVALMA